MRYFTSCIPITALCFLFFIYLPLSAEGAEFAPVVTNFTKKEYKAANQNWAVAQDAHGFLYFGNNNGLLRYEGTTWELFPVPGNRVVRSILPASDGRIYVGSFEEFGYFQPLATGELRYHSLSQQLRKYKMQNDEIWTIISCQGKIYFQSFASFFVFDGKQVTGHHMSGTFLFFNQYRNHIYSHVDGNSLCRYDPAKNKFHPVIEGERPKSSITAVLPYDATKTLLVTTHDGLFILEGSRCKRFESQANEFLMKANANRAIVTNDSVFVIGTILDGVVAVNKAGKILWKLNSANFLQNNTILGMYCDRANNVWLALDKGIAFVRTGSRVKYVTSFQPSIGAIYGLDKYGSDIYIGTNQGLYAGKIGSLREDDKNVNVSLVPRIKGQVWDLKRFGNQLFCCNNEETYCLTGNNISIAAPVHGGVCIKQGVINGQEVLVQGTYTQLCIYRKDVRGQWVFSNVVDNFINPIRYLEIDYQGTIWAAHFHEGLYRIVLDRDLRHIREMKNYTSLSGRTHTSINVFKVANRVVFTNGERFYTFNDLTKEIIPFRALNAGLRSFASSYRIEPFRDNTYWFIRDDMAALVQVENEKVKILDVVNYSSFPNENVDKNQSIVPFSDSQCMICLENGLAFYNLNEHQTKSGTPFKLCLKSVTAYRADNSAVQSVALSEPDALPFTFNSIQVTIAYPNYGKIENVRFRYKLDGWDKKWTDPKNSVVQEYVRLPYGKYCFRAEVVASTGEVIDRLAYDLEILPPFYLSVWAKIIYFLLLVVAIRVIYLLIKTEQAKKRDKIEQKHIELRRQEKEKSEQQIMKLEKEKLETEVMLKSKELAGSTMSIIKKNDILVRIKEELTLQKEHLGNQYPKKYYDKIVHIIDENLSSEDDWAVFQTNFDRIHENFFRNLHTRYPELTSNDLRLCAYLRLNLSSKDIANLMNISLKGVEAGRYRLRKKLNISAEKNLTEFMIELK